ncbi:hypothetical protein ACFQY0_14285 [Haloferula chungangensis]|uniref:DUF1461 domain-containing protein n=1 Tax=Haloferula chungangensis TaxID=1048331 RepID=A0ABW2L7I1_9BACT
MRQALILTNALLAIFFAAAFAYTFIGKDQLAITARDFATLKTAQYAAPLVDHAEDAVRSNIASMLASKAQKQAVLDEIAEYRAEPEAYIAELTGKESAPELRFPENALSRKIGGWKVQIRSYFDEVVGRITSDLRIFTATNLVAALVALGLVLAARTRELKPLLKLSAMLLVATLLSLYAFIDSFSFYQYLFNWHMGWSYPALVSLSYLYIVMKTYRHQG